MPSLLNVGTCFALLCCLSTVAVADPADPQPALDRKLDQLERENVALKKQLRIEALEKENAALRRRLDDNKATSIPKNVGQALGYAQVTKATNLPPDPPIAYTLLPQWSGLYVGGSFGGAWTKSSITSNETYTDGGEFVTSNGIYTEATSSGSGHPGVLFDSYLGLNVQFGSFIAGAQVEGTLADVNFSSSGYRSLSYFEGAGLTGQTALGPWRPDVRAYWMTSALLRAGVLLRPGTLLYAIGGWTGAQFHYQELTDNPFYEPNDTFWANGGSIGVGLEQKFGPSWSLRAEYRYTRFQDRSVQNDFVWTSTPPLAYTQTNTIQTTFHDAMHVGRLGVSYLLPPIW